MINSLIECCALELAPFGVRINGIAPGITNTNHRIGETLSVEDKIERRPLDDQDLIRYAGCIEEAQRGFHLGSGTLLLQRSFRRSGLHIQRGKT